MVTTRKTGKKSTKRPSKALSQAILGKPSGVIQPRVQKASPERRGHDPRDLRCRIANRLTRTVFLMVAGRRIYQHPSRLERGYVLAKLLTFHQQHGSAPATILADLQSATEQLPQSARATEASPLAELQHKASRSRKAEPQALGEVLVHVLARLGVTIPPPAVNSNLLEAPVAESRVSDR